jgi:mRNA degradation ribonuclease J1/J2
MTNARSWYDFEQFAHMAGFYDGLRILEEKKTVKWTNTATDMNTGGVHGIRYQADMDSKKNCEIRLQHWVHWPNGQEPSSEKKDDKHDPSFLVLKANTRTYSGGRVKIRPVSATWMGKEFTDAESLSKLMGLLQASSKEVRKNIAENTEKKFFDDRHDKGGVPSRSQTKRRDEIPNIYDLTQQHNIHALRSLPGMHFNGEFSFKPSAEKADTKPSYPKGMVHAMLGLEHHALDNDHKPFTGTVSMPNASRTGFEGVTYSYKPLGKGRDPSSKGFTVDCKIWDTDSNGKRQESTFYSVKFKSDPKDNGQYRLEAMNILGYKPDLTAQRGVGRALRALKYVNLSVQRDEIPMFSEILHEHDLKSFLRTPGRPGHKESDPRTLLQVFGANVDAVFTKQEMGIGSNGLVVIRDFVDDDGEWVKLGIGADWGITFGDAKRDYYHSVSQNFGRYVEHPAAPHIKPYVDTIINVETHEHEDHLRGVARLAKFGFNLPPMLMNRHTYNVINRMMGEEKVEKSRIKNVLSNCHIVDLKKDVDPENPEERKVTTYGDTVIEQWTEVLWSDEEQAEKYFPVYEVYKEQYPEAKTKIRVGPAGHSAHALMFDIDGILYTGDYKLDQTLPKDQRTDIDWLAACRDGAVHVQECTNATKSVPFNPTVAEVKENRKHILREHSGQRIMYDTIGSNAIDIEMFCRAAGEVRKEMKEKCDAGEPGAGIPPFKHIIFAGTAIRNKYRDLNETHNFKSKMKQEYGITTLGIDTKTAQDLLSGNGDSSYIVVMSGTQDEPMSVTHRVSRDMHDTIRLDPSDVIIRGQSPIPVGNNYEIRKEQNKRYRDDFGCTVYDAAEMAKQGRHIYASSHASQDDVRQVHDITGDLLKVLFHGGPAQVQKMQDHVKEFGGRAIVPDKQILYEIDHGSRDVKIAGETAEERVGFREIRANPNEFFNKHRQQATVVRVKDRWTGSVAERMYEFENLAKANEQAKKTLNSTDRGVNIIEDFSKASGNADFPPIGVLHPDIEAPYYSKHKNIQMIVGMDTETTGINQNVDVHTDISFLATDMEGNRKKELTLTHKLPRYGMASVGALSVTGNKDPQGLHRRGLPLRKYMWNVLKAYKETVPKVTKDPAARGVFVGWRNSVFDDPMTMRMMGMGLVSNDMKPMATYGNLQLDAYNLYTAMIALRPDLVGVKRDEKGNCNRTLESACKENGVEYDHAKAHGSLYDSERVIELLMKFKEDAPEVFEQMLMSADFSPSRSSPMIDHILGQNLHLNDQAPLFGYVNPKDRTCTPAIGALVTIDTEVSKATNAIVLNLAKVDIDELDSLSDEKFDIVKKGRCIEKIAR